MYRSPKINTVKQSSHSSSLLVTLLFLVITAMGARQGERRVTGSPNQGCKCVAARVETDSYLQLYIKVDVPPPRGQMRHMS